MMQRHLNTAAWNHVGVYNPRTIARLARLGVDPEIAGTVAPNRRLWGANIEAGFISPDSFAAMTSRLHNAYVTTAKINGRKAAEQLDLFAARAPQKAAQGGFATDATKAYAADVRPELPARFPQGAPLIVSYGGGVDSTGVLVEFVRRGIRPDLILFADTGGEHPETYLYLDVMDAFLVRHGFPCARPSRRPSTTRCIRTASRRRCSLRSRTGRTSTRARSSGRSSRWTRTSVGTSRPSPPR